MLTNNARRTFEVKRKIAMAKPELNKKKRLFSNQIYIQGRNF